jgi:hypothetical protein
MKHLLKTKNFSVIGEQIIQTTELKLVNDPTNHIIVIDCSYSMNYELPKIRKQLKNKLPNLVKENDTVSIIWFSGRNEYGILKEEVEVKSLKDLSDLNTAIDRFLQPVGLTGFVGPLKSTENLVDRISKNRKNSKYAMLFITDGYDNQHDRSDILKQVEKLSKVVNSATFVEYGYYCNRKLLTEMAETIGGVNIFSESFDDYDPIFEKFITNDKFSSKKVVHNLEYVPKNDYVISFDSDNNIVTYKVENGQVLIPENVVQLFYITEMDIPHTIVSGYDNVPYAILYTLSLRMLSNDIYSLLEELGDKFIIDKYTNAFGKYNITEFQKICLDIFNGVLPMNMEGNVKNYLPKEDAYCVMDLLSDLSSNSDNKFYPNSDLFNYERIGAAKKQKSIDVSEDDLEKIKEQVNSLTKGSNLDNLLNTIETIKNSKFDLYFEIHDKNKGYSMSDFVYNSSRPNVSIRVKFDGFIDLSKAPDSKLAKIDTFIYRTYTIIKDGILNIKKLPVSLSEETYNKINSNTNLLKGTYYKENDIYLIDISQLPIINRSMVTKTMASDLASKNYELLKLQAKQKVYKHFYSQQFEKKSVSFVEKYGDEVTNWLKELGITEFNGFAPKYETVKSGDYYNSTELNVKIAGFSSLPSVNEVMKKIDAKKSLTAREEILYSAIEDYNNFINSDEYKDSKDQSKYLEVWLENKKDSAIKRTRIINNEISKIIFSVVLSQNWFTDLGSIENTTLNLNIDNKDIKFDFVLEDAVVEI